MSQHTPTPWRFIGDGIFGDEWKDDKSGVHHRFQVMPFFCEDRQQGLHGKRHDADKEFIIRAVNCHDELLTALRSWVAIFGRPDSYVGPLCRDALMTSLTAIAKAEGRAP